MVRVGKVVRVAIPEELYQQAKQWSRENNMGHRKFGNGNKSQQFSGVLGEIAVHRYLFGEWPRMEDRGDCFDGGIDLEYGGFKLDVKTKTRQGYVDDHFDNSVYAFQFKYPNDSYIFCSYNKFQKVVEICGWTTKDYIRDKGTFVKAGTVHTLDNGSLLTMKFDNHTLPNSELLDIILLKQLYS